jgi:hypothetical protein
MRYCAILYVTLFGYRLQRDEYKYNAGSSSVKVSLKRETTWPSFDSSLGPCLVMMPVTFSITKKPNSGRAAKATTHPTTQSKIRARGSSSASFRASKNKPDAASLPRSTSMNKKSIGVGDPQIRSPLPRCLGGGSPPRRS